MRFFDSNILVYAMKAGDPRGARALQLIDVGGVASVQVFNEFLNVAVKKLKMSRRDIDQAFELFESRINPILPITIELHRRGRSLAREHGFSVYDALIIAAALDSGCVELASEDMQDGRIIDSLTIRNPFR